MAERKFKRNWEEDCQQYIKEMLRRSRTLSQPKAIEFL
jgi:hypothetical protein